LSENEKKKALAEYRPQQARESLEEAQFLLNGGKSLLDTGPFYTLPKRKNESLAKTILLRRGYDHWKSD
jgi:hypothetical protein